MATLSRKIGIAPMTILELTPAQMVSVAAEAGYDFVGLRLVNATPEEPVRATIGITDLIRETKSRLDDTGLQKHRYVPTLKPSSRLVLIWGPHRH
jgi:hypothetical protein